MSGEDELRRRLQELPGPRAGLDVDAVVERARKRRRPKVAAVTAAVTGAGVLIVAPFVVPGLSPMSPSSTVMSDQGAAQEQAPAAEQDSSGDEGAAGAAAPVSCELPTSATAGYLVAFGDDPSDGVADLDFTLPPDGRGFTLEGVAIAEVRAGAPSTIVAAPDVDSTELRALRGSGVTILPAVEAGATEVEVVMPDQRILDAPRIGCAAADGQLALAPVVLLRSTDGRELTLLGEPYPVR